MDIVPVSCKYPKLSCVSLLSVGSNYGDHARIDMLFGSSGADRKWPRCSRREPVRAQDTRQSPRGTAVGGAVAASW